MQANARRPKLFSSPELHITGIKIIKSADKLNFILFKKIILFKADKKIKAIYLHQANFRKSTWKNGGGQSSEIVISPDDGSLANGFDWRISLANVAASGPFSLFSDYERVIIQLNGPKLQLSAKNFGSHTLTRLMPFYFSGDLPIYCDLEQVSHSQAETHCASDLNVIWRKSSIQVRASTFEMPAYHKQTLDKAPILFIYALAGTLKIQADQSTVLLEEGDGVIFEEADAVLLETLQKSSDLVLVKIQRSLWIL